MTQKKTLLKKGVELFGIIRGYGFKYFLFQFIGHFQKTLRPVFQHI